jgi:hypothetical protein
VKMFDLGNKKFVSVRDFKGKTYVDLRTYYFDDNKDLQPGNKGISLSPEQWKKLLTLIPDVDDKLKQSLLVRIN